MKRFRIAILSFILAIGYLFAFSSDYSTVFAGYYSSLGGYPSEPEEISLDECGFNANDSYFNFCIESPTIDVGYVQWFDIDHISSLISDVEFYVTIDTDGSSLWLSNSAPSVPISEFFNPDTLSIFDVSLDLTVYSDDFIPLCSGSSIDIYTLEFTSFDCLEIGFSSSFIYPSPQDNVMVDFGSYLSYKNNRLTMYITFSSSSSEYQTLYQDVVNNHSPDTTVPVITGTNIYYSPVNEIVNLNSVKAVLTATDNVDGNITSRISKVSDTYTGHTSTVGSYTVTYRVTDNAGNVCNYPVTIVVRPLSDFPVWSFTNPSLFSDSL